MKIEAKTLQTYIKKTSLNNTISTINLDFTEEGVKSAVRDISNISLVISHLKREAFETYEAIGEIYLKNARFFYDILNTFEDIIDIEKVEDHLLRISNEKREAYIILADKSICTNVYREERPVIPTTLSIELYKSDLDRVVKDMKLLAINAVTIKQEGSSVIYDRRRNRKGNGWYK